VPRHKVARCAGERTPSPAHVKLGAGTDALRCLRLSDKGVLRWYTDCCRTPIGNTAASPRFPAPAADRRPALVSISHLLKPKLIGFCRRPRRGFRTAASARAAESARASTRSLAGRRHGRAGSCTLRQPWIRSARSASVSGYCFGRARKRSAASWAGLPTRGLGFGRVRGRNDMAREIAIERPKESPATGIPGGASPC
jgi:hypothetical protein